MKRIDQLTVRFHNHTVGVLSISPYNKLSTFEYDRRWLAEGFSISPLELPLLPGVFTAKPIPFNGGFGVFEDSLPDGYGRYLLKKTLQQQGIDETNLTILDKLSIVGECGMGALTYIPTTVINLKQECDDFDILQEKALEVLKEHQDTDAGMLLYNSGNSGGARPKAVFKDKEGHWLIKFRHIYDSKDFGKKEFHYNETARNCGIIVPDHRIINGRYFATKRFDMTDDGNRIHVATAGGILNASHKIPTLDYDNLLALTGYLTQNVNEVKQMYRRMIFNYITDNKDDHCKNFSFMVLKSSQKEWTWRLAPAYDLTPFPEGYNGEHATSVNGKGKPSINDFIFLGEKYGINRHTCLDIIDEVRTGCGDLLLHDIL